MKWISHLDCGPRRVNHAAVALGNKIYSFGGYCSGEDYDSLVHMDVHILDPVTHQWEALALPSSTRDMQYYETPYQRYGHTVVAYEGKAYIWGGRNDNDGADENLYSFDPLTLEFHRVDLADGERAFTPPARDGHSACVLGDSMLIFGGFEEDFQRFSNETYQYSFRERRWRLVQTKGCPPEWRDFHTATGLGSRMYVFGGRSDELQMFHSGKELYFDKIKYLDMKDFTWYEPEVFGEPPGGRRSHSAWTYKGKLYLFGGYNGLKNEHYDTIYQYEPASSRWTLLKPLGTPPKARRRQSCVLIGTRLFVFGGTRPIEEGARPPPGGQFIVEEGLDRNLIDLSDLHVLDFEPSLRTLCSMAFLEANPQQNAESFKGLIPWDLRLDLRAMSEAKAIVTLERDLKASFSSD